MKKTLLIGMIVAGAATFMSCKKDRTCSCTVTTTGLLNTTTTVDTVLTDLSKSEAEAECNKGDSSVEVFGISAVTECELK